MNAIETIYKGYRFRSRLEARWAVFFDSLNIAWDYEKEGFDIGGQWYLPDFWLPEFGLWVEIKPFDKAKIHPNQEWIDLITKFRDAGVGAIVLLRDPDVYGHLRCWDTTDSSGGSCDQDVLWSFWDGKPVLFVRDDHRGRERWSDDMFTSVLLRVVDESNAELDTWHDSLRSASDAFKQARFEHKAL